MIILGYSGLDNAKEYCCNTNVLLSGEERMVQGQDSAAALIINGKIIACAEEERFSGEKHTGKFPINAINYCLKEAGISIDDVDYVCHGFNYDPMEKYFKIIDYDLFNSVYRSSVQLDNLSKYFNINNEKFIAVDHHLSHAASAYFPSGFDEALCVVSDGMGEKYSMSVYQVKNGQFDRIDTASIRNSIGVLYSLITHFLGYKFNEDEYKIMGLAAYGDPTSYSAFFDKLIHIKDNGRYEIDWGQFGIDVSKDPFHRDKIDVIKKELFGDRKIEEKDQQDIAAAIQKKSEDLFVHFLKYYKKITNLDNLCMAGGVLLNCKINERILNEKLFDKVYVQPAAGDAGTALGSALYVMNEKGEEKNIDSICEMPFYGPDYSDSDYLNAFEKFKNDIEYTKLNSYEQICQDAAKQVENDAVIGWFQGRMEYGPRALGDRSIVANPKCKDIKRRLNSIVKFRESYRPFAPAILREQADEYFEYIDSEIYRYMLGTCRVKKEYRDYLPGITHVDGSARLQVVDEDNDGFYLLLKKMKELCGCSCIVNTSFNVKDQPMICSPDIAIETFLRIDMDYLYIGNYKIIKRV